MQGQEQLSPPLADISPTNASAEALTTPLTEPRSDADTVHDLVDLVGQYLYDDRQSHGYIFDQLSSDRSSEVRDSPTVDAHIPEKSQSQPSATPPMTPDDTLSLNSSSMRGRSASPSPRSLIPPDLPRDTSQPALRPKSAHLDEHATVVHSTETPLTGPIYSADFSLLRTPSRPPSPSPSPPVRSIDSHEDTVETAPEPETSTLRRHTISGSKLLRRSSSDGTAGGRRRSKIISVHDFLVKRPSTGSNTSKSGRRAGKAAPAQHIDAAVSTDTTRASMVISASMPSVAKPQPPTAGIKAPTPLHAAPAKPPPTALATRSRNISALHDRGADSDPGIGSKGTRFIMHRPKKSLSQVSLALAGLPNPSHGIPMARSANASIGSAMTSGTGVGSLSGLSGDEISTLTHEMSLLQRPPASAPSVPGMVHASQAVQPAAVPEPLRKAVEQEKPAEARPQKTSERPPPLTERSAKRLSGFQVFSEDDDGAEQKQRFGEAARATERRYTHITAGLASTRPLTIISSRAASPEQQTPNNSFKLIEHPTTPPRSQSRTGIPSIPARTPTPDDRSMYYRNSPLPPPPSDSSPEFYLSPIPPSMDTDGMQPAPLPRSPPQHSEPPTPLPLPTPRAKSPVPPIPQTHTRPPREAPSVVPNVICHDISLDHPLPTRPATPPMEPRQRRRDHDREERSDSRQADYLAPVQSRSQPYQSASPPPPVSRPEAHLSDSRSKAPERRRISTAQISGPVLQSTPPAEVTQHIPVSPTLFSAYRPTSPEPETPYQYASYPPDALEYPRIASPPTVSRTQSPPPNPPHRVRSPQAASRVQPPSAKKTPRARSPHPAQEHSTVGHGRGYEGQQQGFAAISRQETAHSAGTHGSQSNRHHDTAPATPVPHHAPPSPSVAASLPTQQYIRPEPRRVHSYQPLREPRDRRPPPSLDSLRFDEYAIPSRDQVNHAGSLFVVAQNGLRVEFSNLFQNRRTVVCFIRHFWYVPPMRTQGAYLEVTQSRCPADQDYMYSIMRSVNAEDLKRAGIDLVIIGLGSPSMIKSYRRESGPPHVQLVLNIYTSEIFRSPFSIYTDPTLRVHSALGMTKRTQDTGPDEERGEYIRHGPLGGLAMVVKNAIRVGMPVWERGGDVTQLGGEFVLGPGYASHSSTLHSRRLLIYLCCRPICSYAHRMRTTRSHAPIQHILFDAGFGHIPQVAPSYGSQDDDDEAWKEDRRRSYARMQARREKRKEAFGNNSSRQRREGSRDTANGYASDLGSGESAMARVEPRGRERGSRRAYLSGEKRTMKGRRGFIVANPDFGPPTPISDDGTYRERDWEGDVSDLPYLDGIGRNRDESYRLAQEMLAYSFGKQ